jgi:hypothetical protein
MRDKDQQFLEEAYRKVVPFETRKVTVNSSDEKEDPTFIGYRGVNLDELEVMQKTERVLPSDVPLYEDNEVLEQVLGSDYYRMSERQILNWVRGILPWKLTKNNKSVNLTKDLQNAKGYGEVVIAVGCTGTWVDLGKGYVIAEDVKDCKIIKVIN